jgi:protein-tyrosine-phosphatase
MPCAASFNAVRVAKENSISLEEHKARPITAELIDNADLVLVMESYPSVISPAMVLVNVA